VKSALRVAYIAGEPSPWRAPHLDRIAVRPEIELTVVYAATTIQKREWSLDLQHDPIALRGPSLPLSRILQHDYPLTPQIWRLLDRERFDVLVIAGWSLLATQLAVAWARVHYTPYLLVAENHLQEARPRWVRAVKSSVLRFVVPQAAGHLVPGTLAREHAEHYGARPDTVVLFPNTVDVDAYRLAAERLAPARERLRESLGIDPDAVVVTQVGRMMRQKGTDELLEAVALAERRAGSKLHLLLVGDGPLRPELEHRARELDLPVTFAGFRQGEALFECYAASDVSALLSHRETWGVVVNEAAAFGLPLLLTDAVGAGADLLRPGENGLLVRSGDVEGQADALVRLTDGATRRRFGERSAELVASWGYDQSVESFIAAVRAASDARRRAPRRREARRGARSR
jgi:glycosyltransferase involved in cell wall biosynthesis